ncbi:cobalamin B12-binding domain-containing protein [Alkalibacter mobilis]|uniref:cobalamin B12-binding domain-containing protein n=1 Tax=Alkalibacter mobilis TaxID=2787712 RepID=UPI00189D9F06|nr:cobalamin-dependent protein [Alkalibacter mobilis]MBF7096209.1 cobalamin-dependent protein [Alkalibacter mobilis]
MEMKLLVQYVGDLEEDKVLNLLKDFVAMNPTQDEADKVISACQEGMAIVGDRFERGEYFVGDLIFAGELMTESMDILKPVIAGSKNGNLGKMVIGTVAGDLHDIGKNIYRGMVEALGLEVFDIGIDQPASAFVEKVREVKPDVLGMSGVLTLAIEAMKQTVDALKEAGLRDDLKIIVGGNPMTKDACEYIGADAFTTNATEGVRIVEQWLK